MGVNFLAEMASVTEGDLHPTPDLERTRKLAALGIRDRISYIDSAEVTDESYWTKWKGTYDHLKGTVGNITVTYDGNTLREVAADSIDGPTAPHYAKAQYSVGSGFDAVLLRTEMPPIYYDSHESFTGNVEYYVSNVLRPWDPSDMSFEEGEGTYINRPHICKPGLRVPSFNVKLPDNVNGMVLNQGFTLTFDNDDGRWDDDDKARLFNTTVVLKKSNTDAQIHLEDFKTIRSGLVENTSTTFSEFRVSVADNLKSLEQPICNTFDGQELPVDEQDEEGTLISLVGKPRPLVYGTTQVEAILIRSGGLITTDNAGRPVFGKKPLYYLAENATGFGTAVSPDIDGRIVINRFESNNRIVELETPVVNIVLDGTTAKNSYSWPDKLFVDVTGECETVKDIIVHIINEKTNFEWDEKELNKYTWSPQIGIVIQQGTVKNAIEQILKNDLMYLIQKTWIPDPNDDREVPDDEKLRINGPLTLRKYNNDYGGDMIETWEITKELEKNYTNAYKNYFSSCNIIYNRLKSDDRRFDIEAYSDNEEATIENYRRHVKTTFETNLRDFGDAREFAELLAQRYQGLKQTLKIAVGGDVGKYELLDVINIKDEDGEDGATVNKRTFNKIGRYIITEINYAQDILTLEEFDFRGEE